MAQTQAEFRLPPRADENEQDRELREHGVILRLLEEAADEIGRKDVCYALSVTEQLLSKQLREVDNNRPSYRLLAFCVKHQKSERLAHWLVADYAGFLPPQRPELIKPEEFAREVVALALGGAFGRAEAQQVLALYEKMERPK